MTDVAAMKSKRVWTWSEGAPKLAIAALSLALAGCSTFDGWFGDEEIPLPGERIAISAATESLGAEGAVVSIPAAVNNTSWAQPG